MSNIEFIPANELPTTEANEVDVLCVENGELKRKAGASLGGGTVDMVIKYSFEIDDEGAHTNRTYELISGSYEEVRNKLKNLQPVSVYLVAQNPANGYMWQEPSISIGLCEGDCAYDFGDCVEVYFNEGSVWVAVRADGIVTDDY